MNMSNTGKINSNVVGILCLSFIVIFSLLLTGCLAPRVTQPFQTPIVTVQPLNNTAGVMVPQDMRSAFSQGALFRQHGGGNIKVDMSSFQNIIADILRESGLFRKIALMPAMSNDATRSKWAKNNKIEYLIKCSLKEHRWRFLGHTNEATLGGSPKQHQAEIVTALNLVLLDNDGMIIGSKHTAVTAYDCYTYPEDLFSPNRGPDISSKIALSESINDLAGQVMQHIETRQHMPQFKASYAAQKDMNPSTSSGQSTTVGKRFAVIIGISDYKDSRIPSLRYSSTDAKAIYKWAISPNGGKYAPSCVKLLVDKDATAKNIKHSLFAWLKSALEEDVVTIYFAGHGSPEAPDSPENLFFLPYDTQYDDIATTGFPMWDIETALKRFIKAKKVVVIADACHAGGVGKSFDIARRANRSIKRNPISSGLQNLSKIGDGVCVITASDESQFSQESKDWGGGHGVFTYFLLKGLKGEADYNNDNLVTLGELIPFLSEQVRRETSNAQCPTVAGKFDPALSIGR